jgi:hypothetical protein
VNTTGPGPTRNSEDAQGGQRAGRRRWPRRSAWCWPAAARVRSGPALTTGGFPAGGPGPSSLPERAPSFAVSAERTPDWPNCTESRGRGPRRGRCRDRSAWSGDAHWRCRQAVVADGSFDQGVGRLDLAVGACVYRGGLVGRLQPRSRRRSPSSLSETVSRSTYVPTAPNVACVVAAESVEKRPHGPLGGPGIGRAIPTGCESSVAEPARSPVAGRPMLGAGRRRPRAPGWGLADERDLVGPRQLRSEASGAAYVPTSGSVTVVPGAWRLESPSRVRSLRPAEGSCESRAAVVAGRACQDVSVVQVADQGVRARVDHGARSGPVTRDVVGRYECRRSRSGAGRRCRPA